MEFELCTLYGVVLQGGLRLGRQVQCESAVHDAITLDVLCTRRLPPIHTHTHRTQALHPSLRGRKNFILKIVLLCYRVEDSDWGGRSSVSQLRLTPTADDDQQIYACSASNPLLERAVHDAITLDVLCECRTFFPSLCITSTNVRTLITEGMNLLPFVRKSPLPRQKNLEMLVHGEFPRKSSLAQGCF